MKALSVRQPWAGMIASGRKTVEVRSWSTSYRGPLLICSGKARHPLGVELHGPGGALGVALCVVELVDVRPLVPGDADAAGLDLEALAGQFAWVLRDPVAVEPVAVSGRLGLFTLPRAVARPAN